MICSYVTNYSQELAKYPGQGWNWVGIADPDKITNLDSNLGYTWFN